MEIIVEENIMVPMRDGVRLATDVYRPAGAGRWPVLLTRVPYNKALRDPEDPQGRRVFLELDLDTRRVIEAGYVIVAQDTRGAYASEGDFTPFYAESDDGLDTVEWAASQPWSNGQVGMFGVSYQGITQWQAAAANPPALRAIAPAQSPAALYPYQGGTFQLSIFGGWTATQGAIIELKRRIKRGEAEPSALSGNFQEWNSPDWVYPRLPLNDPATFGDLAPYYYQWLSHPDLDDFWRANVPADYYHRITAPAFIISGWYDYFLAQDLQHYTAMRRAAGSDLARQQTRILIGPWSHGNFWGVFVERNYAQVASAMAIDLTGRQIRWYDHWLKGISNGVEQDKPVRLFVLGANEWRDEADWPLPGAEYRPFYLHSGGHANTSSGDGWLSDAPGLDEPADSYSYDPNDPAPTKSPRATMEIMSIHLEDQSPIEQRPDVLCYTGEPLQQPLEVIGPVSLVLYIASSARDTDFTGKLVDVHPDGRADILTDGILRARYRDSLSDPTLLEPGMVYELQIDLQATANVFLPGHRVRLEVSSSNFPRFDRNSNTGGTIAAETAADFVVATNQILHDAAHPSRLILPVIAR